MAVLSQNKAEIDNMRILDTEMISYHIIIILLFIKFAFKRTLLKQINIIKTVLKQY